MPRNKLGTCRQPCTASEQDLNRVVGTCDLEHSSECGTAGTQETQALASASPQHSLGKHTPGVISPLSCGATIVRPLRKRLHIPYKQISVDCMIPRLLQADSRSRLPLYVQCQGNIKHLHISRGSQKKFNLARTCRSLLESAQVISHLATRFASLGSTGRLHYSAAELLKRHLCLLQSMHTWEL